MSNVTFLTKEWHDRILEELHTLKDIKLPNALWRLKEAISQWDISENAEYDTAMNEKELIESRISEIEHILDNVEIIEHQDSSEIRYGSTVTVQDEKERTFTYSIVWTWEVDVLKNTISFESPLGYALKWKGVGDKVIVKAPNKKYTVTIIDVK